MDANIVTIAALATELHVTESEISLRVSRLIHEIGRDQVIHYTEWALASLVGYGETELTAAAADQIRAQLHPATT